MLQHSTSNFVYFLNKNKEDGKKSRDSRLKAKLQQILETLSKQAMKEKTPDLEELESALQNALSKEQDEKSHTSSEFEEQT